MPSAGGIQPPTITPLRTLASSVNKLSKNIDTATYIELTADEDCKIYFTSDGSKPTPHMKKQGSRETTFKYKGPFSLRPGSRTVKAIAVARDGWKESLVVTKTFQVDEAGAPNEDALNSNPQDQQLFDQQQQQQQLENDYKPRRSSFGPTSSSSLRPVPVESAAFAPSRSQLPTDSTLVKSKPKEAWASSKTVESLGRAYDAVGYPVVPTNNSVNLPDGPFNPTNYSGTQVNFWGVSPGNLPPWIPGAMASPYDPAGQLGAVTNSILQNVDQPRLSLADVRQLIQLETERLNSARTLPPQPAPAPVIQYVPKEPELLPESPGQGNWKAQLEHIYAHLINQCQTDTALSRKIGQPKLGKIYNVAFNDNGDSYSLNLQLIKPGFVPAKPQPVPPPPPPSQPKEKPNLKAVAGKLKQAATPKAAPPAPKVEKPPPPPKVETKQEKLKKRDPFFETEEYPAEGTLKPWQNFDAEADCERLRKAMKGLGTDEKTIIDVLGYRNANQRVEIAHSFKAMFGKDLAAELHGELSGNFRTCAKALLLPPDEYDASEVKRAVKGLGTDEDALIEILCTRTNQQIKAINAAYKRLFNKEMEKDVVDDTSGHFKKLLVSQIQGNRDENKTFDRTAAQDDARALYEAGEAHWGTDESKFNEILCQRSFAHLRAVFDEYGKISKRSIEEAIKSEFSGDIKNSLLTVVQVIRDKPGYFAQKMHKAMKGLGTNDEDLVRIVVSRCECDMVQIKHSFQQQFKGSIGDWLKDDTSGDYKQLLLALTGDRPPPALTAEEQDVGEPEIEEMEEEHIEREPTLKPAASFNPNADCEALKKAMKGLGTDEAAIIQVMGYRSMAQRLEIVKQYKTMFGKDLIAELKSELSGNFCHVITSLCKSAAERDADELRKAMKGLGTDEECLIEILCTRSNAELEEITKQYQLRHGKKLEESIISETSGNLKRLLVALLQARRPEGNTIDRRKARNDAKALHEAGEKKFGTDESRFNVILCSRSYAHLRATFQEYHKLAGKSIADSITSEMSGDLQKGMLIIVGVITNAIDQYAKILYESMKGLGTNDLSLTRTIVSRCEIDMVQIKAAFERNYKQPLGKFVKDDTSGDYMKILLTLISEQSYIK